jgi:hypothetical protein
VHTARRFPTANENTSWSMTQLEKMLGIASVTFKQNEQRLAIVDMPLKS